MQAFAETVYQIIAKIPQGKVMTYGQIAMTAGRPRAARQVGMIVGRTSADKNLPCHRVVNRFGSMAPEWVFGGQELQRFLLKSEGVIFLPDGNIDLSKCLLKTEFKK